jgi:hypothetical protein
VTQRAVFAHFALIVLTLGGCATQPSSTGKVAIGDISKLPQTTLSGADLDDARSIAMGTARSKGWDIKNVEGNQVLLERPVATDSPQAGAFRAQSSLAPPQLQVETNLAKRSDGTVVALRAFVVTNPGTIEEKRIDYTTDYQNDLLSSLNSLQSSWAAGRSKVTSVVPIPNKEEIAEQNQPENQFSPAPPSAESVAAAPSSLPMPVPPPTQTPVPEPLTAGSAATPEWAPAPAPVTSPAPAPVAETAPATIPRGLGAPVTSAAPSTIPQLGTSQIAERNDMLVLNSPGGKGLWSYYAEDYARLRGCDIGDRGATLLKQTPTFELLEVECVGHDSMLLKCQGGVCEPIQ